MFNKKKKKNSIGFYATMHNYYAVKHQQELDDLRKQAKIHHAQVTSASIPVGPPMTTTTAGSPWGNHTISDNTTGSLGNDKTLDKDLLTKVGFELDDKGEWILKVSVQIKIAEPADIYRFFEQDSTSDKIKKRIKKMKDKLIDKLTAKLVLAELLKPREIKD